MTVIAHLSDPHFGTEQPPVMAALLRWVRAQAPDAMVVSGDITQRARPAQFHAARAYIDSFGVADMLVVPGNHDIPLFDLAARLISPYARYAAAFGNDLEPELDRPDLLVACVNTTRPARHKNGVVSPGQIERVARRLARARASQLRVVVTHQPVLVTRASERKNLLRGHQEAARAWSAAGADLLLGGHIHLPYVCALRDHHAGLARNAWVVQAGTAVSSRVRRSAPNSVNLIRYDSAAAPASCVVERWDYSATQDAFDRVATTAMELHR